jgi:mono/diheme cytochrome c family protein
MMFVAAKSARLARAMRGAAKKCLLAVVCGLVLGACSKDSPNSGKNGDWQRGRAVFVANCVACHNSDPSREGPLGPAIKGSSKELLEARILRGGYPPDYKPKRPTKVMPQFPFLKNEISYLHAYLANDPAAVKPSGPGTEGKRSPSG